MPILRNFRRLWPLALLAPRAAHAVCPVCTVAVGFGVGLSRWLGIDDVVSGLWIGGFTVSLIVWTLTALEDRQLRWPARGPLVTIACYLLVVLPLYFTGVAGHPLNTLWGVDRLLLGIVIGSLAFWAGAAAYLSIKAHHGGHAWFPFQKVVMPVAPLLVLSLVFYFALK